MRNFWEELTWPVIGLSPMDGVTDAAFRYITAKYGKPAVIFTEFTAAEGIRAGAERLLQDFLYSPLERPVVAQLFGADPSAFYCAAAVACALGFDGIDINMGCPAKNIAEKGAGAALIADPPRARDIITKTREGITAWAEGVTLEEIGTPPALAEKVMQTRKQYGIFSREVIPVSVKTRIGYDKPSVETWIPELLEAQPAVISLHGRTLKQLYTGEANWEVIAEAAALAHAAGIKLLGNGDIISRIDATEKIALYGVDGVLIGRAAYGNPWIFQGEQASEHDRLATALEHARYFASISPEYGFLRMRKHLLDYTRGFEGAKELRSTLMRVTTLDDVEAILIPLVS